MSEQNICITDLLQSSKFLLVFPRIKATAFFCQAANVPGITATNTLQNTPFSDLPIPGDKINYAALDIEFLIDDELQSWTLVHDWLRGYTFPTEFKEYSGLKHLTKYSESVPYPQYADAELIVLSAQNNPRIKFKFLECFPISLSGIQLDIRAGAEKILTATASFRYKRYDIERVN